MWLYPHPFFSKIIDLVADECLRHAALPVAFVLVKAHSVISTLMAVASTGQRQQGSAGTRQPQQLLLARENIPQERLVLYEVTGLADEGRAVDALYLDFRKAFNSVSHNILIDKLTKYGLDKWTMRWTENWLNCQAQGGLISSTKSNWVKFTS
ncbi:hypothetical protein QYF61_002378, partial [Mycteria americana]